MFHADLRHIRTILETPNGSRPRFRSRQAPKPNTQIGRRPEEGLTVGHAANSIQAACWASIFSAIPCLIFNLVEVSSIDQGGGKRWGGVIGSCAFGPTLLP